MRIGTEVQISAAHFVQTTKGKCSNIHGHNWTFVIEITGRVGGDGMVVDFGNLKRLLSGLDHKLLIPEDSPLIEVSIEKANLKISVREFFNPEDPTIESIPETPEIIKSYSIPTTECFLLPLSEITAESLAEYVSARIVGEFGLDNRVRVYESEKSWAEVSSGTEAKK